MLQDLKLAWEGELTPVMGFTICLLVLSEMVPLSSSAQPPDQHTCLLEDGASPLVTGALVALPGVLG